VAKIDDYLRRMIEAGASDLHISAGVPIRMRLNGDLIALTDDPLDDERTTDILGEMLSNDQKDIFDKTRDLDIAYDLVGVGRFRANIFDHHAGLGGAFRAIPAAIRSLEDLGLPAILRRFCELHKGLVLVTGATGSGKSTTLAAMIDYINRTQKLHVITIEDPVEFIHKDKSCLIHQREVGKHAVSFASALRAALREDPDVILVGELRDLETIELAVTAAETGHLVFGTLHTMSATKSMDRIINVFPTQQQEQIRSMTAESMAGIVCQNLVKRIDAKGRVPALEILIGTTGVASLIRDGKTHQLQTLMQTGRKLGMQTMDQALANLVLEKRITLEAAIGYASSREALERTIAGQPPEPPSEPASGSGGISSRMKPTYGQGGGGRP
jgi:twitching motility protein PilT